MGNHVRLDHGAQAVALGKNDAPGKSYTMEVQQAEIAADADTALGLEIFEQAIWRPGVKQLVEAQSARVVFAPVPAFATLHATEKFVQPTVLPMLNQFRGGGQILRITAPPRLLGEGEIANPTTLERFL